MGESRLPAPRHSPQQRDIRRSEVHPECLHERPAGDAGRVQAEVNGEALDLLPEDRDPSVGVGYKPGAVGQPLGQIIGWVSDQRLGIDA